MRLDLTTLLNGRASRLDVDTSFVPDPGDETMAALPPDITLESPVRVIGSIHSSNGYMTLETVVSAAYVTRCDRCLADVHGTVEFPFRRLVTLTDRTGDAADDGTDPEDLLTMTDSFLDAEGAIMEELSLEMPVYHLCRPDCPGLCPKCGKRLADGGCSCGDKKEIDPRLAILQKLLDNSENQ